jgi:hypothetical protein
MPDSGKVYCPDCHHAPRVHSHPESSTPGCRVIGCGCPHNAGEVIDQAASRLVESHGATSMEEARAIIRGDT